jgi:RimJ/RimL family protein N-acetyltransferase
MDPMPVLETARLSIRPFRLEDLEAVHRLLGVEIDAVVLHTEKTDSIQARAEWLQWTVLNYAQLAILNQPPYGDRAVILRHTDELIGSCGFVPCLNSFEQIPGFGQIQDTSRQVCTSAEFGLFYAIAPSQRRQGYAVEAARALLSYAFQQLQLRRVIATTDYDNIGSIGVMKKLGMRIEKNPRPDPPWLQVVGVLEAAEE